MANPKIRLKGLSNAGRLPAQKEDPPALVSRSGGGGDSGGRHSPSMASAIEQLTAEAEALSQNPNVKVSEALRSATWKLKGLQAIDATEGVMPHDLLLISGFLSQLHGAIQPSAPAQMGSEAFEEMRRARDEAEESAQQLAIEGEKLRNELSLNEKELVKMWELMKRNNEEAHIKITELQGSLEAARAGSASSTAEEMQKKCEESEKRAKALEAEVDDLAMQLGGQGDTSSDTAISPMRRELVDTRVALKEAMEDLKRSQAEASKLREGVRVMTEMEAETRQLEEETRMIGDALAIEREQLERDRHEAQTQLNRERQAMEAKMKALEEEKEDLSSIAAAMSGGNPSELEETITRLQSEKESLKAKLAEAEANSVKRDPAHSQSLEQALADKESLLLALRMTEGGLEASQEEIRLKTLSFDKERQSLLEELDRRYQAMRNSQDQTTIHDSSYRHELNLLKDQLNTERSKRRQLETQLGMVPSSPGSPMQRLSSTKGSFQGSPGPHHGSPVGVRAVEAQLRESLRVAGQERIDQERKIEELQRTLEGFGDAADADAFEKDQEIAALKAELEIVRQNEVVVAKRSVSPSGSRGRDSPTGSDSRGEAQRQEIAMLKEARREDGRRLEDMSVELERSQKELQMAFMELEARAEGGVEVDSNATAPIEGGLMRAKLVQAEGRLAEVSQALRDLLEALDAANESESGAIGPSEADLLSEVERVANETVEAKEKLLDELHAVKVDRDAMQAGWQEMKSTAEQAIQAHEDLELDLESLRSQRDELQNATLELSTERERLKRELELTQQLEGELPLDVDERLALERELSETKRELSEANDSLIETRSQLEKVEAEAEERAQNLAAEGAAQYDAEVMVSRLRKELQECDQARAIGERALQQERRDHLKEVAAIEAAQMEERNAKIAMETELFGVKAELQQLRETQASVQAAAGEGGSVMWDQIKTKAKSSRAQFQKMRESKEEIIRLKAQLARYESDPDAIPKTPIESAMASNLELNSARKNVSELEQALEESESLVTALASALTAAGGDKAMLDVAARLKDRAGVFNA